MTVHLPRTGETGGLIGAAEPRRAKPTAYMINVAHGSIIDEAALHAALSGGEIAGGRGHHRGPGEGGRHGRRVGRTSSRR